MTKETRYYRYLHFNHNVSTEYWTPGKVYKYVIESDTYAYNTFLINNKGDCYPYELGIEGNSVLIPFKGKLARYLYG